MKSIIVALILAMALPAHATIVNGTFETGDLNGWEALLPFGYSEGQQLLAFDGYYAQFGAYPTPEELQAFLQSTATPSLPAGSIAVAVAAGSGHTLSVATEDHLDWPSQGNFDILVKQSIFLHKGDTLRGMSCFFNGDYEPQDSGWARLYLDGTPYIDLWGAQSGGLDYLSLRPWESWNWTADMTGLFDLTLGVSTFGDNRFSSYALFDNIEIINAVPEPPSAALMAVCLSGLVYFARRIRTNELPSA